MCGISGTNNLSKLEVLYQANVERGNFASGLLCLKEGNSQTIIKQPGCINFDKLQLSDKCDYYISHNQAPTSVNREFKMEHTHPFETVSWAVVHNGVISNWKELKEKYTPRSTNTVDTSIITGLLQHFTEQTDGYFYAPLIIRKVLELLEGTFALAIVDTDSNDVYLARQGSILHYNDKCDFSTIKGKGFELLPEGQIMMLRDFEGWEPIEEFKTKSPFLFV
jgi:glucosamine--fructose-6-phosphate aminotransferase (isomerizing)